MQHDPDLSRTARRPSRLGLLLLAPLMLLAACGSGTIGEAGDPSGDGPTEDTVPVVDVQAAKAAWPGFLEGLGAGIMDGGVGVGYNEAFGVSGVEQSGDITVWKWDGTSYSQSATIPIGWLLFSISVADLTQDGNDDIYVNYMYGMNRTWSGAFTSGGSSWTPITFDGSEEIEDGTLSGSTIQSSLWFCESSCAEGWEIPVTYSWNGVEMAGTSTDSEGNSFTLKLSPGCDTFTPQEYAPLKLCDKGPSVRYLQQILYDWGILEPSNGNPVDGYFGPETEYAVKVAQYMADAPVTGVAEGQWYYETVETYNLLNGLGG